MSQNKNYLAFLPIAFVLVLAGCGANNSLTIEGGGGGNQHTYLGSGPVVLTTPPSLAMQQADLNSACGPLIGNVDPLFVNEQGQDILLTGSFDPLEYQNTNLVTVTGLVQSLTLDSTNLVVNSGTLDAFCVRSRNLTLSGDFGAAGIPVVLMGADDNSNLSAITGGIQTNLVIIGMTSVGSISGVQTDIYISGGTVQAIEGEGGNLFLDQGATVINLSGTFASVNLSNGASINSNLSNILRQRR